MNFRYLSVCFRRGGTWLLLGISTLFFAAGMQAAAQSVSMSASTSSLTIHPGDQKVPLTVTLGTSTYTGPVTMTVSGLPTGVTVSPINLTAGGSGTLYLNASLAADQEDFIPDTPSGPNTSTMTVQVVAITGSAQSTLPLTLTVSLTNPAYKPAPGSIDIPIMKIDTGGVAITSKDVDVSGTVTITSADGQTTYLPNSSDSDNTATFHVHGNSTAEEPKLPYNLKLNTSLDLLTTMGLSCPYVTGSGKAICDKSKSYILLANYDDKTLLRDWAASALANAIPMGGDYLSSAPGSPTPSGTTTLMPWAPHSLFVELYINGEYEGNYQLIEKVNVDSHRINITELDDSDTSGDLSGGYQMEIDKRQGEDYNFITPQGVYVGMDDPDYVPEVPEQESYISGYTDEAENVLFSEKFTDPTEGWRAYFDEAAAINFFIVNDLMGNSDGGSFFSSDYFYKAADNPLIYMGPIWDFDVSSGNINSVAIINPTAPWMQINAPWYVQWLKDPSFKADLAKQWNALKNNGVFSQWLTSVSSEAVSLQQAQTNNFGRWPMLGVRVWPNAEAFGSYDSEVAYMTNWINIRMGYLDAFLNGKAQTNTTLTIPSGTLRQGSAITVTATVTGGSSPTGKVYLLSCGAVVGVGSLDGSGTAKISTNLPSIWNYVLSLPQTTDALQAVYVGDDKNALSSSNVTDVSVLLPVTPTSTLLTASGSSGSTQTPLVFSIAVVANSGATVPNGVVNLVSNGAVVASATLSAVGTATFAPADFPGGSDSVQAVYAGNDTFSASSSSVASVTAGSSVAAPVFSLAAGSFTTAQSVTITDATSGATIYYTLDGSVPTTASTVYSAPINITTPVTLSAVAIVAGYDASQVTTASYNVVIPDFSIVANPGSVTFNSNPVTMALTITPQNGFQGEISFSCSGLPAEDACAFSPATLTPGTAASNVTVTLSKGGQQSALNGRLPLWTKLSGGVALALLIWPFRRRKVWAAVALFFLLAASLGISGCSSPKGFLMTITASGGGVSHSTTVVVN